MCNTVKPHTLITTSGQPKSPNISLIMLLEANRSRNRFSQEALSYFSTSVVAFPAFSRTQNIFCFNLSRLVVSCLQPVGTIFIG
jgi:hypothetical protein